MLFTATVCAWGGSCAVIIALVSAKFIVFQ